MASFEYRVVPAPTRGMKGKGIKGPEGRFANALEDIMNQMAADGWEYQRAETLPSEERSGLTSTTTTYRNVLVFRRARASDPAPFQPRLLESAAPQPAPLALPDARDAEAEHDPETPQPIDDSFAETLRRRAAQLLGGRGIGAKPAADDEDPAPATAQPAPARPDASGTRGNGAADPRGTGAHAQRGNGAKAPDTPDGPRPGGQPPRVN